MTAPDDVAWVRRTEHVLRPDPGRVVGMLFLPGQELAAAGVSRSSAVVKLSLPVGCQFHAAWPVTPEKSRCVATS